MAEAIVSPAAQHGLRVVVTLTRQHVQVHAQSGWIDVVSKGDKRRRLPLNAEARKALHAILPTLLDGKASTS